MVADETIAAIVILMVLFICYLFLKLRQVFERCLASKEMPISAELISE
jgi:flagellar biogenesis protein FliO